ncbi:MAG: helix-turn-helix domain-containing protein [Solirubrobacteraceae bacterium]
MGRLLTADELAERLGAKTDWVWAQARAGRIPHVRLGRYRRFGSPLSKPGFTISRRAA